MSTETLGIECRFVVNVPSKSSDKPDVHLIKEQVWKKLPTGETVIEPNIRLIEDFKRPFWITKPNKRNHTQKKEEEAEENLFKIMTTESNLRFNLAKALGKPYSRESVKELCSSPYIYGADISSSVLIKQRYLSKYPDLISGYTVCTYDTETDVVNGTEEVIINTAVFKDKIICVINKDFVKGFVTVEQLIRDRIKKYIQEYIDKRDYKTEIYIEEGSVNTIKKCFQRIHELKPDFLAIWNMDFDIPKVLWNLEKYDVDPTDVLCDPSVPKEYRICKYKKGPTKKVTSSGKVQPIDRAMQWHTLQLTASFYVIDAMCAYRHLRNAEQERSSYSLNAILDEELNISKLKFKEADEYQELAWHVFMQNNYKLEYVVYNMFDSMSMLELEYKINDLSFKIPTFSRSSEFSSFRSQPKRIMEAYFFNRLASGYVLGSVGSNRKVVEQDTADDIPEDDEEEEDNETLSLRNWIVTLPSHLMVLGLKIIEEDETMHTLIRGFTYDSDSVSAYPTVISCMNVSKETTKTEIIDILGIDEDIFRLQNMNFIQGQTNSIEYCTTMFNLPKPYELLRLLN